MSFMTARFAIKGVRKSDSRALFHACGGCSPPRCLYKVTKKISAITNGEKKFGRNSDALCRIWRADDWR